jgi:hypothetical protein
MPERVRHPQRFPIMYPGSALFVDADSEPSGAAGAIAHVPITLNTRPHEITGFRVRNLYEVPPSLQDEDGMAYLRYLDDAQDIRTDLAQQNVIVRPADQRLIVGAGGVHWHPFECPYPFRGGNNIVFDVTRTLSYPSTQEEPLTNIVCKVLVVGWAYMDDETAPGSPPSTDFPETGG